ncbi:MAG: hypothetical protein RL219_197 [Actinomycetota bacterium]|jgi:hypothetical protein
MIRHNREGTMIAYLDGTSSGLLSTAMPLLIAVGLVVVIVGIVWWLRRK